MASSSKDDAKSGSRAATRSSASAQANIDGGFKLFNSLLRSLLAHPMGVPLAALLHAVKFNEPFLSVYSVFELKQQLEDVITDKKTQKKSKAIKKPPADNQSKRAKTGEGTTATSHPSTDSGESPASAETEKNSIENVFENAVTEWRQAGKGRPETSLKETDFTKRLAAKLDDMCMLCTGGSEAQVNAPPVVDEKDIRGRMDLVLGSGSIASCVIEVGIDVTQWWKKVHQVLLYAENMFAVPAKTMFPTPADKTKNQMISIGDAVLVGAIVMNGKNIGTIGDAMDAKFGLFLCTRKTKNEYRLSLLWREATNTIDGASKAFGKILRASNAFEQWSGVTFPQESEYEYLGPNCCRLGNKVSL